MARIAFTSNASPPYNQLSNFFEAPIHVRRADISPDVFGPLCSPDYVSWIPDREFGTVFPSSEHFWQSLKARDLGTFNLFTVRGPLGALTPDAFRPFAPSDEEAIRMCTHWSKKRNVGILAKMAVGRKWQRVMKAMFNARLLYVDNNTGENMPAMRAAEAAVWTKILVMKMEQNPDIQRVLVNTGTVALYERANRNPGHWALKVCKDGTTEGENAMGRYMMATRNHFARYNA